MVDIDLEMSVVDVAVVAGRMRMGRAKWKSVVDMEVGRKFAEGGSKKLKTDLGHRMSGNRKDLVIAVRRNLRNHPYRRMKGNVFTLVWRGTCLFCQECAMGCLNISQSFPIE